MLLVELRSGVADETIAVLVKLPVADASMSAVTSTSAVAPTGMLPSWHRSGVRGLLQSPCVAAKLTRFSPAGGVSVRTTAVASDGPLFVTTSEYTAWLPGTMGLGDTVLVTTRSAWAVVGEVTVAKSLAAFGSGVVVDTRPLFVTGPVTEGATRAMTVTLAEVPAARVPNEQTGSPPFTVHDPVDGAVDVTVRLLSGSSVTTTLAASDGPAFVAVSK